MSGAARLSQEQRLAWNHAASKFVGCRANFHPTLDLPFGQDDGVSSHFGKNHRFGGLKGLRGEHLHAHVCMFPLC